MGDMPFGKRSRATFQVLPSITMGGGSNMTSKTTQVIIVGGGPVGLSTSLLLAQFGVRSILVERNATTSTHPKASYFNTRTMEILRQIGVAEDVYAGGGMLAGVSFYTNLSGHRLGGFSGAEFPDYVTALLSSTATPGCISSQIVLEAILERHAASNGHVDLRFSHECQRVEQTQDDVTAYVLNRSTGEEISLTADYLIACDGAGSRIRTQCGRELLGPAAFASMMNVYFRADLARITGEARQALYWISNPNAAGVIVGLGGDWQKWCYLFSYDPTKGEFAEGLSSELCMQRIRAALGTDDVPVEILSIGPWSLCGQVIDQFRHGRIFFGGDAAHLSIPTGGFGFNTGMQEVHNLAWKLAFVIRGLADHRLLDTYHEERRPIAVYNVEVSRDNAIKISATGAVMGAPVDDVSEIENDTAEGERQRQKLREAISEQKRHFLFLGQEIGFDYSMSSLVCADGSKHYMEEYSLDDPVYCYVPNARPGARAPHCLVASRTSPTEPRPIQDYLHRGFVCLVYGDRSIWEEAVASCADRAVVTFHTIGGPDVSSDLIDYDGMFSMRYGLDRGGAVLVRPDGHIAWRAKNASCQSAFQLKAALARTLGRSRS